ncbi:hypothetical protein D3C86_862620 [compost metagenome]
MLERFEDELLLAGRYANAGVGDHEGDHRIGAIQFAVIHTPPGHNGLDADLDAALFSELEGVGQQVLDHLQQALFVGPDDGGQGRRQFNREGEAPAFGDRPEGAFDLVVQIGEQRFIQIQCDRTRLDLGQIENLVDQLQQVFARATDGLGIFDLPGREIVFRVVAELPGQDQQAVQWRSELMGHTGEEFGLVLGGQHQLLRLLLQRQFGDFDFAVLALDFGFLLRQQSSLVPQFLVGLSQFFLLPLQLLRQRLRLLEQFFGTHIGFDRVEHDTNRFSKLIKEGLMNDAVARERSHFDDGLDLVLEQDRQHDDIQRGGRTQSR